MITHMNAWGKIKARVEKEINRRFDNKK